MISNYLSNMSDAQLAPLTLDDQADPFNPRTSSSPTTNPHSDNRRVSADLKLKQTGSDQSLGGLSKMKSGGPENTSQGAEVSPSNGS